MDVKSRRILTLPSDMKNVARNYVKRLTYGFVVINQTISPSKMTVELCHGLLLATRVERGYLRFDLL
jgi:hypothetical protein